MLNRQPERQPEAFQIEVSGELTVNDIWMLATTPKAKINLPSVQDISTRHYHVARMVADGLTDQEIAVKMGRTAQYIRNLRNHAMFDDLVDYYFAQREDVEIEDARRIRGKLVEVAEMAIDSVHILLETNPETVSVSERRQWAQLGLDRTVAPPKTSAPIVNQPSEITFNIMGPALAQIKTIEGVQTNVDSSGEGSPRSVGSQPNPTSEASEGDQQVRPDGGDVREEGT